MYVIVSSGVNCLVVCVWVSMLFMICLVFICWLVFRLCSIEVFSVDLVWVMVFSVVLWVLFGIGFLVVLVMVRYLLYMLCMIVVLLLVVMIVLILVCIR